MPATDAPARRLRVIGIGAGSPRHLTVEAAQAIAGLDAVLLLDKDDALADLAQLRHQVLAHHARPNVRQLHVPDPPRDLPAKADRTTYAGAVARWHDERAARIASVLEDALSRGGTVGILVWGDPSLYDSTLRLVELLLPRLPWPVATDVIAGVSSLHLLTAAFAVPLNRVGAAVVLTTGRRLAETPPDATRDVAVFLDGATSFTDLTPHGIDLYWGAYLGSEHQVLCSGPLAEIADEVVRTRAAERSRRGWMFDTYLLRWVG